MIKKQVLYDLLEVPPNATQDEIKKSYRQLALKYHPDKCAGDEESREKFQKFSEAYNILSNPEKRRMYDETGIIDGQENFEDTYQYFRNLFPKVTISKINDFSLKYKKSAQEEADLLEYYKKHKGDMTNLIENIILAENEDAVRFIAFFENQISLGVINRYPKFDATKDKIKLFRVKSKKQKQGENENDQNNPKQGQNHEPNVEKEERSRSKRKVVEQNSEQKKKRNVIIDENESGVGPKQRRI